MKLLEQPQASPNGLGVGDPFQERFQQLLDQIAGVVVTSRHNIRLALVGLFAQGARPVRRLARRGKNLAGQDHRRFH